MSDFFRTYVAGTLSVPTYFIESTAPNSIDDEVASNEIGNPASWGLRLIDPPDDAAESIARILADGDEPNLVVMVHGFNNPRDAVLKSYADAAVAINNDSEITNRPSGLVCVGYRWPSERMGQPHKGSWRALPTLPTWILYLGLAAAIVFAYLLFNLPLDLKASIVVHVVTLLGLIFVGLVLTAALLRVIVYFRDVYRATNYGIPDLIHIIRTIDSKIIELREAHPEKGVDPKLRNVQLSFIGHSMGGYVVTSTIRALSNMFDETYAPRSLASFGRGGYRGREGERDSRLSEIGNVFRLMRFVLASPDIPAEHLLSSRANFLASALTRFKEAYLFSNEGDEVLRQISTLANYFSFPTKSRDHGFRLGNVEILARGFGVLQIPRPSILAHLRIGNLTLQGLYEGLQAAAARRDARAAKMPGAPLAPAPPPGPPPLPEIFSYFDCTDYIDSADGGAPLRPLLTRAKLKKQNNPAAKLPWYWHLWLLIRYLIWQDPNVHGGYFDGFLARQIIFRLACLGFQGTSAAYGGIGGLSGACSQKQIRVLLSPHL